MNKTTKVLAVDPGKDKCGVALFDENQSLCFKSIVPSEKIFDAILPFLDENEIILALGNGTTSQTFLKKLTDKYPDRFQKIVLIDEYRSTDEARKLYFQENPPTGWKKFLPLGLLSPPCSIDDYAAMVIAKRYFKS